MNIDPELALSMVQDPPGTLHVYSDHNFEFMLSMCADRDEMLALTGRERTSICKISISANYNIGSDVYTLKIAE